VCCQLYFVLFSFSCIVVSQDVKNYLPGFLYGKVGGSSSVGIATCYGLDGPGIESQWGARFSAPFLAGLGAHPASCTMGTGSF